MEICASTQSPEYLSVFTKLFFCILIGSHNLMTWYSIFSLAAATKKISRNIKIILNQEYEKVNLTESWHKTMHIESQSRRFQLILNNLNKSQEEYRNKSRALLVKDMVIIGKNKVVYIRFMMNMHNNM